MDMKIFNKVGVTGRLAALVGVALLGIIVMQFEATVIFEESSLELRETELTHLTDAALSVAEKYHQLAEKGELSQADAQAQALREISSMRYDGGNYFWVNNMDYIMLAHGAKPDLNGRNIAEMEDANGFKIFQAMVDGVSGGSAATVSYQWPRPGAGPDDAPVDKISVVQPFGPWGWVIGTGAYLADIDAAQGLVEKQLMIRLGILSIVLLAVAALIALAVSKPLQSLMERMNALSNDDTESEIPYLGSSTLFGDIAGAVDQFRVSLIERAEMQEQEKRRIEEDRLRDEEQAARQRQREQEKREAEQRARDEKTALEQAAEQERHRLAEEAQQAARKQEVERQKIEAEKRQLAEEAAREAQQKMEEQARAVERLAVGLASLSQGVLDRPLTDELAEAYEPLRRDFNAAVANLSKAMSEVIGVAAGINGQVSSLDNLSIQVSSEAGKNAAAIEETAAALEEMTSTVREMANSAQEISASTRSAGSQAEDCGAMVDEMVRAMESIEGSSSSIASIITMIDEIAFQTSLLALNAGVEAARAGDAGRGFAVVASEVGMLAQKTSDAAKEISDLIGQGAREVRTGVELVDKTRGALLGVVGSVRSIRDQIESISVSSREQSSAIEEINNAVSSIDVATQQTAQRSKEMTDTTKLLRGNSQELSQAISAFSVDRSGTATIVPSAA